MYEYHAWGKSAQNAILIVKVCKGKHEQTSKQTNIHIQTHIHTRTNDKTKNLHSSSVY